VGVITHTQDRAREQRATSIDENVRITFDRLVSEYEKQQPAYETFAAFNREVLANTVGKLMPYAVVEARAKEMASFAERMVRSRITQVSGVAVHTRYSQTFRTTWRPRRCRATGRTSR
jgi:ppGpp synthetase/RelA/SpoT-type nucleotidyltranferase